jgi:hypothetical protein
MLKRQCGPAIELTAELEGGLLRVSGDPTQIEQVALNLVLNARDAMPGGGTLSIRVTRGARDRPGVVLAVSDTGRGMEPEVRARLFEPFFSTKSDNGTGLGLAIVSDIVQRAGGTIEVESALGRGSEFRVILPAAVPEPAGGAAARP